MGLGAASSNSDGASGAPGGVAHEGLVCGSDGAYDREVDTSSTQGVLGGEDEDEDDDDEGEMANFIVLDCSKVTNVSQWASVNTIGENASLSVCLSVLFLPYGSFSLGKKGAVYYCSTTLIFFGRGRPG